MARPRFARRIAASAWVAAAVLAPTPPGRADILPTGTHGVAVTAHLEWGPLAGRLARPVAPKEGDTWATLAERETGDPDWAGQVAAMNGGGAAPPPGTATVWVPPVGALPTGTDPWYSAYAESAKWPSQEISRTGLRRVGPGPQSTAVFGTVEVFVLRHSTPEDAARSHAVVGRPGLSLAGERGLLRSAPVTVPVALPDGNPTVRMEQDWRVEGLDEDAVRLVIAEVRAFDAQGRRVSPSAPAAPGVSAETPWLAVAAFVLVAAAVWERARRRRKAS